MPKQRMGHARVAGAERSQLQNRSAADAAREEKRKEKEGHPCDGQDIGPFRRTNQRLSGESR